LNEIEHRIHAAKPEDSLARQRCKEYIKQELKMIRSAEEFYQLRTSENQEEYLRAAWEEAPIAVWRDVIRKYPDMHFWVAQNKTVPNEILEELSDSPEWRVRHMIASKNKIPESLQKKLAVDRDPLVRSALVRNRKIRLNALFILQEDEDEEIRAKARERIEKKDYKE